MGLTEGLTDDTEHNIIRPVWRNKRVFYVRDTYIQKLDFHVVLLVSDAELRHEITELLRLVKAGYTLVHYTHHAQRVLPEYGVVLLLRRVFSPVRHERCVHFRVRVEQAVIGIEKIVDML